METIGKLCLMLIRTGACKDGKIWHDKKTNEDYVTCISGCKKLDEFMREYWEADKC